MDAFCINCIWHDDANVLKRIARCVYVNYCKLEE